MKEEASHAEFNVLQHKAHRNLGRNPQQQNDKNVLFTSCEPPKMFRAIIKSVFVPIKDFDATNPNRQRRRRMEKRWNVEEIKSACLLSLSDFLPSGSRQSLHRVSRVYQVCCGWLMMWVSGSWYQFIPKFCNLASLWILFLAGWNIIWTDT